MKRALLVLACAAGLFATASIQSRLSADQTSIPQEALRSNSPSVFALTDARVVVSPDVTLEKATIVVRGGKIESVGDVAAPADAQVISMAGKTVYPGFIDAYAEQSVSGDPLAGTARYWNGQVSPQISMARHLVANEDLKALRKQGIVAQLIAPAAGVIRGTSAVVSTGDGEPNQTLLAADVAQHLHLTVSRRGRETYPGSPMGAVALARQAIYDAQWYRDARIAVEADATLPLPEHNDALAALQPVLNGAQPVVVKTSNEQFVLRADQFAAEFGLSLIVVGNGREYRRMAEIAATKRPIILPLAFPKAPNVSTPETAQDATLESLMHWDIAPENPARVDSAGISFAFTTERLESKADFLKSLRKAVSRGLSPKSALKALTTTPAALFGLDDQLGTIQSGHLASFVITDGDLFEKRTKVLETWVSGQRFEHSPEKVRNAAGYYRLDVQPTAQFDGQLFVEITDDDGKLQGRISRQPIPAEPKKEKTKARDAKKESEDKADNSPESSGEEPSGEGDSTPEKSSDEDKSGDAKEDTKKDVLELSDVKLSDTAFTATLSAKDWGFDGVIRVSLTLTELDAQQQDRPAGLGAIVWPDGATASVVATRVEQPKKQEGVGEEDGEKRDQDKDEDKDQEENKDAGPASFAVNYPLGAFGREMIPGQPRPTAFIHATIWTCGPAGLIEDGTLIVADGKIVAVGKEIAIPEGADVIDVRGMHITPGVIDCHSHAATDGGVNEATQAITCEVRVGDFVDANDITIYRQLAGGVTAANVLHGSANPIGGQNQVIKLRWGQTGDGLKFTEAPQGVKFALGENVKQSNWENANNRYPQTRMGVEQLYRDSFEAARDYARKMDAWKLNRRGLPPRRDLELDALREILDGDRWIHCHSYRQDEILALLRILKQYEITIGTFQHILEGYKVADEMAKAGAMASAFSDWWAYKFEVYDAIPHAGALMHKQGVVVSFNSDDGELARHLNQEAAKAVKYGGVPREEALKFVTLNPAKQLRIDHLVGSVEVGKHADFVIWNGDPLSNFSRCEQTWIDGRCYFHRDEDDRMQRESFERRNVLIQKILESGEDMHEAGERDTDPSELWPRTDEFCHHFRHKQSLRSQTQE
jgi:N-acetylglucosamine-6-phosphate deacetylase